MEKILVLDPLSLECMWQIEPYIHFKHSPLHDAVKRGHVKCVKFLLEKGADVTSLTTFEDETILHTLYNIDMFHWDRLNILELLLNYGASCMFSHNKAGKFAIGKATSQFAADEVSLLLQHGVTLTYLEAQTAMRKAWQICDLSMAKLLFLHFPNETQLVICFGGGLLKLANFCDKNLVLPGVPLDFCCEKYLETLKLFKAFGGKLSIADFNSLEFTRYRRTFKRAKKQIKTLISNPMSLKEISRLTVRNCICKDYLENIKKLELPVDLQPFFRFDDIIITELPDYFDELGGGDVGSDGEDSCGDDD